MPGAFPGISQAAAAYQQSKKPAPGVQAVRDYRGRPGVADPMTARHQWAQFVSSGGTAAPSGLTAAQTGGRPEGSMARLNGQEVQWTKDNNGRWGWLPFQTEGQMARAALASAQPPVTQQSVVAPGQGAPSPVVSPVSRARAEALNTASQQAGGPNLSKPLVPTEAELNAQKGYAAAREANPLAAVPELLDQRSQAYGQRAGIDQWLKAMQGGSKSDQAIAQRFLAKQRNAGPSAMQADAAGLRGAYGGDLNVGPGAKALEEVPYQGGISPAGAEQLKGAYSTQLAPGTGGSLEGLAYQGPAPMTQPQAMQQGAQGLSAAFGSELSVAPQASAQQSNLNGPESPLVQATTSQSLQDQQKAYQMQAGSDLLAKYRLKAGELNSYWRG